MEWSYNDQSNNDQESNYSFLGGETTSFITFLFIILGNFSSSLLCCCLCSVRRRPVDEYQNVSHFDEAMHWARKEPVSWYTLLRYVQIGCQVAVEGFVSIFETSDLYKRVAVVLSSSGQRVRTFKSLQKYGIIVRFGRTLNAIHELVLADVIEMFPKLFETLENEAEGDDIVERLHNIQVAVIAELVGPRLTALDHAVVNFAVMVLIICCSIVLFFGVYFPTDVLISRWIRYLLGYLSDDMVYKLEGPEDGTSLYRVLLYFILLFFFGSIFFIEHWMHFEHSSLALYQHKLVKVE